MRTPAVLLSVAGLIPCLSSNLPAQVTDARTILEHYLAAPIPAGPPKTDAPNSEAVRVSEHVRLDRIAILNELSPLSDEALAAAEPVIFKRANSLQRAEIVSMLGDLIQTRATNNLRSIFAHSVAEFRGAE